VALIRLLFTANGSWTVPARVYSVRAYLLGGGGGGGGGRLGATTNATGGAGGGGAKLVTALVTVVPGAVHPITIGLGGTAGAVDTTGGDGGLTEFGSFGSLALAKGAQGGGRAKTPPGAGNYIVPGGHPVPIGFQEGPLLLGTGPYIRIPGQGGAGATNLSIPGTDSDPRYGAATAVADQGAFGAFTGFGNPGGSGGASEWPGGQGGAGGDGSDNVFVVATAGSPGVLGSGGGGGGSGDIGIGGTPAAGGAGGNGLLVLEWEA